MKKMILSVLLAALLLCSAACAPEATENNALSDALSGVLESKLQKSETPAPSATPQEKPTESIKSGQLTTAEITDFLTGWWVDVNQPLGLEYPYVCHFAGDDRVHLSLDAYYCDLYEIAYEEWVSGDEDEYFYTESELLFFDGQPTIIGRAYYNGDTKGEPIYGEIHIDKDADSLNIVWSDGETWICERNTTPRATAILLANDGHYGLAESAKIAYGRFDEASPDQDGIATIWVNEIIWVDAEDADAIRKYGLEHEPFNNDYEIYDAKTVWDPLLMQTDATIFRIWSYDEEWGFPVRETVDYETFRAHIQGFGEDGALVQYATDPMSNVLLAIMEVYIP